MKYLLLLFITLTMSYGSSLSYDLNHLSNNQRALMLSTYHKAKQFNLGYTMTAILWKESTFGRYNINLGDPSCGNFHIMPKYLIKRTDLDDNNWNRSRLCSRLMTDPDFSFSVALIELKFWQNYWKAKGVSIPWSHTVASYNAGTKWYNGKSYLKDIKARIKILKHYMKQHNIK